MWRDMVIAKALISSVLIFLTGWYSRTGDDCGLYTSLSKAECARVSCQRPKFFKNDKFVGDFGNLLHSGKEYRDFETSEDLVPWRDTLLLNISNRMDI